MVRKAGPKSKTREEAILDEQFPEVSENPYGDWLRRELDKQKISAWELAEKSGVSGPQIYNILAGRSLNPQQNTRNKLETALKAKPAPTAVRPIEEKNEPASRIGELVDFDPHAEELLPNTTGVYVFYDITNRPIYVGKAIADGRSIRTRVKEHYEKFWFKRPIVNLGAYIEIKDVDICASVEKALIKFLKTNAVLNKQNVDRS